MIEFLYYFGIAALGAGAFELLLVAKDRNLKPIDSPRQPIHWRWIAVFMGCSGFLAWAYHASRPCAATPWDLIIAAIAVQNLAKGAVGMLYPNQVKLGEDDGWSSSLLDFVR